MSIYLKNTEAFSTFSHFEELSYNYLLVQFNIGYHGYLRMSGF